MGNLFTVEKRLIFGVLYLVYYPRGQGKYMGVLVYEIRIEEVGSKMELNDE